MKPAIEALIQQARAQLDDLASLPGPRTYENTMAALDMAAEPLDVAVSVVRHLEGVVMTAELRAAWNEVQPEVSAFYSSIPCTRVCGRPCRPMPRQRMQSSCRV